MIKYFLLILLLKITSASHLRNTNTNNSLDQCKNLIFEKFILKAICKDSYLIEKSTELNLDECIVNFNGILLFTDNPNSFLSQSCNECKLEDFNIKCKCEKIDKTFTNSSLNLKEGINNENGKLKCVLLI